MNSTHAHLIETWRDGKLTGEDLHALAQAIADNPELADDILFGDTIAAALDQEENQAEQTWKALQLILRHESPSRRQATVQGVEQRLRARQRSQRRRRATWYVLAASAAAIFLALGLGLWYGATPLSPPVSRHDSTMAALMPTVIGVSRANDRLPAVGSQLSVGDRLDIADNESISLQYDDGSILFVHGGSRLSIAARSGIGIDQEAGLLEALVTPGKRPVRFRSQHGEVTVTGTSFSMQHTAQDTTVVVSHGSVLWQDTYKVNHNQQISSGQLQPTVHRPFAPHWQGRFFADAAAVYQQQRWVLDDFTQQHYVTEITPIEIRNKLRADNPVGIAFSVHEQEGKKFLRGTSPADDWSLGVHAFTKLPFAAYSHSWKMRISAMDTERSELGIYFPNELSDHEAIPQLPKPELPLLSSNIWLDAELHWHHVGYFDKNTPIYEYCFRINGSTMFRGWINQKQTDYFINISFATLEMGPITVHRLSNP